MFAREGPLSNVTCLAQSQIQNLVSAHVIAHRNEHLPIGVISGALCHVLVLALPKVGVRDLAILVTRVPMVICAASRSRIVGSHITLLRLESSRNGYISSDVGENELISRIKGIQDGSDSKSWVDNGLYVTISALGGTRLTPLQTLIAWLYS